jgi:resuscitation-promoting factor RpfB
MTQLPEETRTRPPRPRTLIAGFGVILALVGVLVLMTFIYLLSLTRTTEMTLVVNGERRTVNTHAETVAGVLAQAGITVEEGDALSLEQNTQVDEGLVVELRRARNVTISVDGNAQVYRTTRQDPAAILQSVGVTLAPDDRVTVDGTPTTQNMLGAWPVPANQITIRRAIDVTVNDGGVAQQIRTTGATVGEALYDAGVTVYVADAVSPSLDAPLTPGLTIAVARAMEATVIADGTTLETRTRAETVGGLLADAGVSLMGLDYVIPDENVAVQPGMSVRVIRVEEAVVSETAVIPFEDISRGDDSLELDQVRIIQPGANGLTRTNIRLRYENGVEISREEEGTVIVQDPQNRVVVYGTGVVVRTVDTPDGPREYWRRVRMYATSYHPAALGGDNITATGQVLTKGVVGIDPNLIPYGTQVYVPGYGVGVAADTGPPRGFSRWIDLGYDDENWVSWSRQVDVYILTPVPANIAYVLPE